MNPTGYIPDGPHPLTLVAAALITIAILTAVLLTGHTSVATDGDPHTTVPVKPLRPATTAPLGQHAETGP